MKYNISDLYNPKFINSWKDYSLKDLAEWLNGRAFRKNDYSDAGYPVIKIAELNRGISSGTQYSNSDNIDLKYKLSRGDLLFSWSGNPKTSIDAHIYEYDKGWLNQHIYRVIPKEIIRKDYCYYVLKYIRPNFEIIASNKQTTGLGHVTKKDLEQIRVRIPELGEQKLIENTLSSLDDKIELNNKINENLEEQAQAIFKHWFVDFEFPDKNGNPYKSSDGEMIETELGVIPKGFKMKKLKDISTVQNGFAFKSKDYESVGCPVLRTLNIKGSFVDFNSGNMEYLPYDFYNDIKYEKYKLEKFDTLLVMVGATIGKIGMTLDSNLPSLQNQNMWRFRSLHEEVSPFYIRYQVYKINNEVSGWDSGSARSFYRKGIFQDAKIVLPENIIMSKFHDIISMMFERININRQQNQNLEKLRDTLLPKLMSGKLRIPLD